MLSAIPILIVAVQFGFAATASYTYDAAGRLVKIDYGASGSVTYTYDKAGNLTSRIVQAAGGSGGVITSVNVAGGGSTDIAQNTWLEIRGTNLVPASTPAAGVIWGSQPEFAQGKLPTQLSGVSVTINGKPGFVYFYCSAATSAVCTSDQINVLTPLDNTTGPVPIVVTSGANSSGAFMANLKAVSPAFLLFSGRYVAATHADFSLLGPTSLYPGASTPGKQNETVLLYAVGFGLPSGTLTNGSSSQSGSLPTLPVCKVGGASAAVGFAGVISPGLYQINLTIPGGAASGDNPISCTYTGASTPAGDLITVQ